ncbi:hypothetical protein [Rhodopirellula sp. P2]|uniref:hypothetical protein n=1 Tax=Rhodopirellula sp. P2 TaxID=2127060 RepID=UPI00236826E2|nr:hypothetical protein [Rhodopirellula sp. P2]WDQ15829.1 hypothetical protein PSR62_19630 [Rhodopirellula sp. P2]
MNATQTQLQNADQQSVAATANELGTEMRDRQPPLHPEPPTPSNTPRKDSLNQFASWLRRDARDEATTYLHRANTHHDGE